MDTNARVAGRSRKQNKKKRGGANVHGQYSSGSQWFYPVWQALERGREKRNRNWARARRDAGRRRGRGSDGRACSYDYDTTLLLR